MIHLFPPAMKIRRVPDYPLTDYVPPTIAELGISVARFEVLNQRFDRPSGVHRHEHFELFWLEGPATHFNDFESYALPAGQPSFILVSPGQLHRWEGADDIRGTLISFTSAFFDGREPPPGSLPEYGFVHRMEFPPVLMASAEFATTAAPLVAACEREFARRQEHWLEVIRASLRILMAEAARAYRLAAPDLPAANRPRHLLQQFQARIETDFRTMSTVAEYARDLGVTPGHLNDTVRELTSATAGELIRSRIVLEARRLLFHSDFTVSEVAYHLGFEDPSYFAKAFRKATGQSPAAFREEIRKNHPVVRE